MDVTVAVAAATGALVAFGDVLTLSLLSMTMIAMMTFLGLSPDATYDHWKQEQCTYFSGY